jgi:hypothetical protein
MDRRQFVVGVGTAVTASLGGCLGVITGSEPAEFEATPPAVDDSALSETGYESAGVEEIVVERQVEAGGQSREVVVTNYMAQYEKAVDLGPLGEQRAALFTALTTPQVDVLGQEFNPIADMSTRELAQRVQGQYEGIEDIQHQEDSDVTIHDQTTTQSTFTAQATLSGQPVDIILHVSEAVELGEDLVVTVGAYPERLSGEEQNVLALMEAVRPQE